eukprot:jgi/Mesvir1/11292/Mv01086-RA.1
MVANLPETLSPAEGAGRKRAQRAKGQISRGSGKTYLARLTKILRHLGYEPDKDGAKPVTPLLDTKKVREAVDALSEPSERGGKKDRAITKKTNAKDLFSSINSIDNQMDAGKRIPQDVREAYVEDMATSQEGLEANAEFVSENKPPAHPWPELVDKVYITHLYGRKWWGGGNSKDVCKESADQCGHKYLVARDIAKGPKVFTHCKDLDDFKDLMKQCSKDPKTRTVYEIIRPDHVSKAYFDLDDEIPIGDVKPDLVAAFTCLLEAYVLDVLEGVDPDKFTYHTSVSDGVKDGMLKLSNHIVVGGLFLKNGDQRQDFIKGFGYYIREHFLDPDSQLRDAAAELYPKFQDGWVAPQMEGVGKKRESPIRGGARRSSPLKKTRVDTSCVTRTMEAMAKAIPGVFPKSVERFGPDSHGEFFYITKFSLHPEIPCLVCKRKHDSPGHGAKVIEYADGRVAVGCFHQDAGDATVQIADRFEYISESVEFTQVYCEDKVRHFDISTISHAISSNEKHTYIIESGMGTGKSEAIRALEKAIVAKNGDARIVNIFANISLSRQEEFYLNKGILSETLMDRAAEYMELVGQGGGFRHYLRVRPCREGLIQGKKVILMASEAEKTIDRIMEPLKDVLVGKNVKEENRDKYTAREQYSRVTELGWGDTVKDVEERARESADVFVLMANKKSAALNKLAVTRELLRGSGIMEFCLDGGSAESMTLPRDKVLEVVNRADKEYIYKLGPRFRSVFDYRRNSKDDPGCLSFDKCVGVLEKILKTSLDIDVECIEGEGKGKAPGVEISKAEMLNFLDRYKPEWLGGQREIADSAKRLFTDPTAFRLFAKNTVGPRTCMHLFLALATPGAVVSCVRVCAKFSFSVFDVVFPSPDVALVTVPAPMLTVVAKSDMVGVTSNVYVAPLPNKLDAVPLVTVMSPNENPAIDVLKVAVTG